MADAQPRASTRPSTVSSCAATDCAHNEDRNCEAGEIELTMSDGKASCATYTPETPKPRP